MKTTRIAGLAGLALATTLLLPGCGRKPSSTNSSNSSSVSNLPSPFDMNPQEVYTRALSGDGANMYQVKGIIQNPIVECQIPVGKERTSVAIFHLTMRNDVMPLQDAVLDANLVFDHEIEGYERYGCLTTRIGDVPLGGYINADVPVGIDTKIGQRWNLAQHRMLDVSYAVSSLYCPDACFYLRSKNGIILVNSTHITRTCAGNVAEVYSNSGDVRADFRAQGIQLP